MFNKFKTSALFPQKILTKWLGNIASSEKPWLKNLLIEQFIKQYQVDMSEAINPDPHSYRCFNEFFIRELKQGARIIDDSPKTIISPADGAISQFGTIKVEQILQAKDQHYTLTALLTDKTMADLLYNGEFMTTYLSPKDYHRVHMPITGKLIKTIYVPGKLFPVFPYSVETVEQLFARNERLVCLFETAIGPVVVIMVGATIVASIATIWNHRQPIKRTDDIRVNEYFEHNIKLQKGEEMGHFQLGSTTIMLFPKNTIKWLNDLNVDMPVKMGQAMATMIAE